MSKQEQAIKLPYITDELWLRFCDTSMMTWNKEAGRPEWTQDAVDLAAVIDFVTVEHEPTHDPFAPEVGDWCEFSAYADASFNASTKSVLTKISEKGGTTYVSDSGVSYKHCRIIPGITALKHDGSSECPECMRDGGAVKYKGEGRDFVWCSMARLDHVLWNDVDRYIPRAYLPAWWGGGDES